nr:unnamed protein product [Spirometra erinaceieuropaei]
MTARVTNNGVVSEAFAVTNGVKQDRVHAPTFFDAMFSALMMDANRDERPGIRVAYRTDGHLLNHWRVHFQSRVSTTSAHGPLFVDDGALNAAREDDMQRRMRLLPAAYDNFGLIINTGKTVVTHQPPPDGAYVAPQINVDIARDRPTWRGAVVTGSAINESIRITAAKVRRETPKVQQPPPQNVNN